MTTITEIEKLRRLHENLSGWGTLTLPDYIENETPDLSWLVNKYGYQTFCEEMQDLNREVGRQVMELGWIYMCKEVANLWKRGAMFTKPDDGEGRIKFACSIETSNLLIMAAYQIEGTEDFDVEDYWNDRAQSCSNLDLTKTEIDYADLFDPVSTLLNEDIDPEEAAAMEKIFEQSRSKHNRAGSGSFHGENPKTLRSQIDDDLEGIMVDIESGYEGDDEDSHVFDGN